MRHRPEGASVPSSPSVPEGGPDAGGEHVTIEFVESVIYRYLSTATAGVDFNKDICFRKAHLPGTKAEVSGAEWLQARAAENEADEHE